MSPSDPHDVLATLLPRPKRVLAKRGTVDLRGGVSLTIDCGDRRIRAAGERITRKLVRGGGGSATSVDLRVVEDAAGAGRSDGYRLSAGGRRIVVVGGSAAACYYGLQTLGQMIGATGGMVSACEIEDEPDFRTRGLLHDVTRGKVPTLATLKLVADRLALLKCNQLQLNIEHAFVFSFDPDICDGEHGITPGEVRELDAYCRERFLDLVPALSNLGHMGRVLSMPRYRRLARIETASSWEQKSWSERARGLTLDVSNPEALVLVERMWADVLDAFSSPVVNICGDEPWDLGAGKNGQRLAPGHVGEEYLEHLRRIVALCASRGRRCQAWSDVLAAHPELDARLPRSLTLLHWGYDDNTDYAVTGRFVAAGLDTFVCPGTLGWKRMVNAMGLAERNISTFARAGREHGATGLLSTDWGDLGHFNQLACSWHGIAMGAACGWDAQHPVGDAFDRRFAKTVWGYDDATPIEWIRRMSAACGNAETWRLFCLPGDELLADPTLPGAEGVNELRDAAAGAASWFKGTSTGEAGVDQDFNELAVASKFVELFADRVALLRKEARSERTALAPRVKDAFCSYRQAWLRRNKPAGLDDIAAALGV